MSSNDSEPPAQRRRKLVLRKIPNLGPLPVVRPPQKSIPFISFELSADAEAAAAITSSPSHAGPLPAGRASEAEAWTGASHAFAHPASSLTQEPPGAHRAGPQSPASDANLYPTMPPVVASSIRLPVPMATEQSALLLGQATRAPRRSSRLLAVGGSVAGVVLAATLGVAVGERTARPKRGPATMQAVSPAVEFRPPTSVANAARGSQPIATPAPVFAAPPIQLEPTTIGAPPVVHEAIATSLTAQPARAPTATHAAAVPTEASTGSAIATPTSASSSSNPVAAAEVDPATPSGAAAMVPEIPPSPPPAVDPLVQAVREDIREEQTHTK